MTTNDKQQLTYFIADLHLAENRPDITACFLSFLENDAVHAEKLYVLGDLFEYWLGDDDDSPFVAQVANAFQALSTTGTEIYFIHGNRDFLIGKRFAKKAGITLLPEVTKITLYQQEYLILHGDTLCTLDVDYQQFRRKSRTWWWQAIIKSLPLFVRKKIANNYRQQSAQSKQMKSLDIMDVTPEEVIKVMSDYQVTQMIHGHTHRPNIHSLEVNQQPATRIVLGDWYEQGSWLAITPAEFKLLNKDL